MDQLKTRDTNAAHGTFVQFQMKQLRLMVKNYNLPSAAHWAIACALSELIPCFADWQTVGMAGQNAEPGKAGTSFCGYPGLCAGKKKT